MNDILKAIETRSSTRGYTDQKPTKEQMDALLNAALQAPTAANRQEIHISVVDGSDPILAEIEKERAKGAVLPHNFYYEAIRRSTGQRWMRVSRWRISVWQRRGLALAV